NVEEALLECGLPGRQRLAAAQHVVGDELEPGGGALVEEGVELVILLLGDGIVLMVVTLGTADGNPQPDCPGGGGAIDDGLDAELLEVDAALLVDHRVALEAGGYLLVGGGAGQEVAGQLLRGEPVEGQVAIQCGDDPVAVFPDDAGRV